MSSPGPGAPGSPDSAALQPSQAHRFAAKVDALEEAVVAATEALRQAGDATLATGSGQDNAAIASWWRGLLADDTVPAAGRLTAELDGVRRAVRESTASWEDADAASAQRFHGPGTDGP